MDNICDFVMSFQPSDDLLLHVLLEMVAKRLVMFL